MSVATTAAMAPAAQAARRDELARLLPEWERRGQVRREYGYALLAWGRETRNRDAIAYARSLLDPDWAPPVVAS